MRASLLASLFLGISSLSLASNPRGDDLLVEETLTVTNDFTLSPELLAKANEAREEVIESGNFGITRTNPDGIVVSLKIEKKQLWVTAIGISGGKGDYTVDPTIIPTKIVTDPVPAVWFTGKLTGFYGRLLQFHLREYGYRFEIKDGKIISRTSFGI